MAESFVDSFKTELIADRVWHSRTQLELAVVEYVAGSTTSAYTKTSATGHPERSKNSTLRKQGQRSPHHERQKLTTRPPSNPVRLISCGLAMVAGPHVVPRLESSPIEDG